MPGSGGAFAAANGFWTPSSDTPLTQKPPRPWLLKLPRGSLTAQSVAAGEQHPRHSGESGLALSRDGHSRGTGSREGFPRGVDLVAWDPGEALGSFWF